MREKIIEAIIKYWSNDIFPGIKMETFIREVIPIYAMLGDMGFINGNGVVAITGESSKTWIAAYIATLLRGCTLVILPNNLIQEEIDSYLLLSGVNLIITDDNNSGIVSKNTPYFKAPLLKGVYNAESFIWVWLRQEMINTAFPTLGLNNLNVAMSYKNIKGYFHNVYCNDIESVITPTSGTVYGSPKYVVSSESSIDVLITKTIDLLPYDMGDTIYCDVPFCTSHYLTVLIPFIKGCTFEMINPRNADVFIEDTPSLQLKWRKYVDSVLEIQFLNWLFVKTPFRKLFKGLAVKRLKSYYNKGKKLKSLIVYNAFVAENIISALKGKMPLFTTYGSQECNQLIAYNDYSSRELKSMNCAGEFIRGYDYQVDEETSELIVSSKSMFLKYQADLSWTDMVRNAVWYHTGDAAKVTSDGILYIYGRTSNIFSDRTGFSINLDNMERIIKNVPYINEAQLTAYVVGREVSFILNVEADISFTESKNLGLLQLKKLFRDFANKVQEELLEDYEITRVKVRTPLAMPLQRTFDGKINRRIHKPIIEGHYENVPIG